MNTFYLRKLHAFGSGRNGETEYLAYDGGSPSTLAAKHFVHLIGDPDRRKRCLAHIPRKSVVSVTKLFESEVD